MIRQLWQKLTRRKPMSIGQRGEQLAADHLKQNAYRILERNLKTKQGELDIVALSADQQTVVFVEVKTAVETNAYHMPEFRVDQRKQNQLVKLAAFWCRRAKLENLKIRFDVIGVSLPPNKEPQIRHLEGAFESRL